MSSSKFNSHAFVKWSAAFVLLCMLAVAFLAPTAQAQIGTTLTPTVTPTATQAPPNPSPSLWLLVGQGQTFQGECAWGSEPEVFTNESQWQVWCMPINPSQNIIE